MMMTFVNMDAPGITILPTHRVLFGLAQFDPATFLKQAEELFTVEPLPHNLRRRQRSCKSSTTPPA